MNFNELALWSTALVFLLKIVCFILGYLTIKLGAELLREGVKGGFNFSTEIKGLKSGLVSSSPGLLFVLLGILLIGYAMGVDKPFKYTVTENKPVDAAPYHSEPPHDHQSKNTTDSLK